MSGLLLDTHFLLWLGNRRPFALEILQQVDLAARNNSLYASHISLWELGVAINKKQSHRRPELSGLTPPDWFADTCRRLGIQPLAISAEVASEAALVPEIYESGDPGDCFLIASARVHNLILVTRDEAILKLAEREPTYLSILAC